MIELPGRSFVSMNVEADVVGHGYDAVWEIGENSLQGVDLARLTEALCEQDQVMIVTGWMLRI